MENINIVSEKIKEINSLRKRADEMEHALKLIFGDDVMSIRKETKQHFPDIVLASNEELTGTFFNKVKTILSNVEEMKGKDIHAHFSEMPYSSFSAQLSTLVKKGKIQKRVVENASNSDKYFYHL